MSKAFASAVIDAPVEVVWAAVRDFLAVARWIPGSPTVELVASCDVPVRRISFADGRFIDEPLLILDDVNRLISYGITTNRPRSFRSFQGTAHVRPITDGDRSLLEWTSEFDCDEDRETTTIANVTASLEQIVAAVGRETQR